MRSRAIVISSVTFVLVFLLGFGASEIVRARRVIIGDNQVVIGQDAFGGYIVIRDIRGNEVFSVQGGEVRTPTTGGVLPSAIQRLPASVDAGARVAQLQDVRPFNVDPAIHDEIREMIAAAEDFEEKAREMEQQAGELRDGETRVKTYHYWNSRGDRSSYRITDSISNKSLRDKLHDHALDLKKLARAKRGEARRHQRAIAVPRQVISAWNGTRQIILITKSDMGSDISKIPVNGFFAWTGSAARPGDIDIFDRTLEHYELRSVKVVGRPEGWQDAP